MTRPKAHAPTRRIASLTVALVAAALVLPAAGQGARPNPGAWDSMDWSMGFTFTVKGKKKPWIRDFNPTWQNYWTCADTGEQVWTQMTGFSARVRGGSFSTTQSMFMSEIGRQLTATLSGYFYARDRASGTIVWSLAGCGSQTDEWSAYGPATKKGKKKGKGKGGGGGGGGCQWMWDPIIGWTLVCF